MFEGKMTAISAYLPNCRICRICQICRFDGILPYLPNFAGLPNLPNLPDLPDLPNLPQFLPNAAHVQALNTPLVTIALPLQDRRRM